MTLPSAPWHQQERTTEEQKRGIFQIRRKAPLQRTSKNIPPPYSHIKKPKEGQDCLLPKGSPYSAFWSLVWLVLEFFPAQSPLTLSHQKESSCLWTITSCFCFLPTHSAPTPCNHSSTFCLYTGQFLWLTILINFGLWCLASFTYFSPFFSHPSWYWSYVLWQRKKLKSQGRRSQGNRINLRIIHPNWRDPWL